MIKIENVEVCGWSPAIRGMRNAMNSWNKSDSEFNVTACWDENHELKYETFPVILGDNDHNLMENLGKAGTDHRKFMRYLAVYVDITAPLYWWKEFKTYRHGRKFMDDDELFEYDDDVLEYHIETNSCSTMHKIHAKEFTLDDFSHEHIELLKIESLGYYPFNHVIEDVIRALNYARSEYLKTKDKKYWWQMIQLLPSSYNQKRTVMLNYEVLANMYKSRKNHKLDEWVDFCKWIESLPYSELITGSVEV